MDLNEVKLLGRIGKDLELKGTGNKAYCKMNVATNFKSKGKDEITDWHPVISFGVLAENCAKSLKKGSRVFINGHLKYGKYEDRNKVTHYTAEIIADTVTFL